MANESIAPRAAGLIVIAVLLTACTPQSSNAAPAAPAAAPPAPASVPATPLVRGLPDFATLVEQVGPAVVNVTVVEKRQRNPMANPFSDNDPFSDFFRQFQNQQPRDLPPEEGVGSGFIAAGAYLGDHGRRWRRFLLRVARRVDARDRATHRPARVSGQGHRQ